MLEVGKSEGERTPSPPLLAHCNYACSATRVLAAKEGARANVNSSWPRHYRGCSFSSLPHSFISFGHPSNSPFFSLRLLLPSFLLLPSTSFGLSWRLPTHFQPPNLDRHQDGRELSIIASEFMTCSMAAPPTAAAVGRIRREGGRKEKLTTTLPSYFPWQITICAKSLPPSCRLSQCVGRRLFASNGTERNGNEIARAGRMSKAESQRDAAPPPLGEDPQPI